uniref:Protein RRP6-like 2 n=1 Tax=Tanacetum cinerariifolium TaxID=118510 RepID=A0A6L2MUQ3_TANCI|nr:protein RRP6-like 2 [Tanacetum cinerariifolium]
MFDTGHQECLKWSEIVWTICCCTSVGSLQTKNIKQQTCQVCIFKTDEACPELTLTDKVYIVYQVFEQKVQNFLELFKEKRTLDVLYEVLNPSFPIISHLQDI